MELILSYDILESYKRLPYKAWYALAEFIDNSTQSYRNNKPALDADYKANGNKLEVVIIFENKGKDSFISIEDNAFGMNETELQNALTLGRKPANPDERSRYGLGLKTAAFWFGNEWEIHTTQMNSTEKLIVKVSLNKILADEKKHYEDLKRTGQPITQFKPQLDIIREKCSKDDHRTQILITDVVKKITPQTATNCKENLQSIYRMDLKRGIMNLFFSDSYLTWDNEDIDANLLTDENGKVFKKDLNFTINGKTVWGWAAIRKKGGKKYGGFSLLQADRVIVGFPKSYKNSLLFGTEDGGRNDLTNQRLVGELNLDREFAVSHTKDQILFTEEEEEELDKELYSRLADYKKEANIPFKNRNEELSEVDHTTNFDFSGAAESIVKTISGPKFYDTVYENQVLPAIIIEKSNEEAYNRIESGAKSITYKLGKLTITIYVSDESSPYDPYLIVRAAAGNDSLKIVINKNHPYWIDLKDNHARFHFLLNCIYDGVAEWKAEFLLDQLDPDTVKMIKDSFLRIKLESQD